MEVSSVIYCIGNLDHSICKIGYTLNVNKVLTDLQVNVPFKLSILGIKDGGYAQEQVLHGKFRKYHIQGDWFQLHKDLIETFNIVDIKRHFLVYDEYITILNNLSCILDIKMLMVLASYLKFNEYCLIVTPEIRRDVMNVLGITTQSFSNSINRLTKTDILKKRNNKYIINPLYIWKGTDEERKKLIKDLNIETL